MHERTTDLGYRITTVWMPRDVLTQWQEYAASLCEDLPEFMLEASNVRLGDDYVPVALGSVNDKNVRMELSPL